jgi:hypothetical protein
MSKFRFDKARCPGCDKLIPERDVRDAIDSGIDYICEHGDYGAAKLIVIKAEDLRKMIAIPLHNLGIYGFVEEGTESSVIVPGHATPYTGAVVGVTETLADVGKPGHDRAVSLENHGHRATFALSKIAGLIFPSGEEEDEAEEDAPEEKFYMPKVVFGHGEPTPSGRVYPKEVLEKAVRDMADETSAGMEKTVAEFLKDTRGLPEGVKLPKPWDKIKSLLEETRIKIPPPAYGMGMAETAFPDFAALRAMGGPSDGAMREAIKMQHDAMQEASMLEKAARMFDKTEPPPPTPE